MNKDIKHNKNNLMKNKYFIICLILTFIIMLIVIATFAYSKYIHSASGKAKADIAKLICTLNVIPYNEDAELTNPETVINPYCIIEVKNNESNERTQTNVNYSVEIIPEEGFVLPNYYWVELNTSNPTQGTNQGITGNLGYSADETKTYKLVFENVFENDITKKIDFKLVAIQAQ